jgi:putative ABC transport system permease protein
MLSDLTYALRQLRKAPGFAATAILTLALGIGATTAIFTLVHAVLLKSLPVAKPEELYRIGDKVHCCVYGGKSSRSFLTRSINIFAITHRHLPI